MKKKVLIVEDDQLISYILEDYVKRCECTVVGAVDNGLDAIEIANKEIPDYILMDVRIEGDIDGIETAISINEKNQIPIIYVSGNSDEKTMNRALETNMTAFLVKPVSRDELCKILGSNP